MILEINYKGVGGGNCKKHKYMESSSVVNNIPAKHETQVQYLSQEDPLEKEMATHSCFLAWEIPGTEETGGL